MDAASCRCTKRPLNCEIFVGGGQAGVELMVWSHIIVSELVWLADKKLVWRCFGAESQTGWSHVRAQQGGGEEHGLCLFTVFIHWYLLLRQTVAWRCCSVWKAERWLEDSSKIQGRSRGHSGHKAISDDGWWRLQKKRSYVLEKPEPDVSRLNVSEAVYTAGLIPDLPSTGN